MVLTIELRSRNSRAYQEIYLTFLDDETDKLLPYFKDTAIILLPYREVSMNGRKKMMKEIIKKFPDIWLKYECHLRCEKCRKEITISQAAFMRSWLDQVYHEECT
jgi:hypothetical protein